MRPEPTVYETMHAAIDDVEPIRRFGKTQKPIPATETYRRVVSTLMRNGIRVEKWIIINERDHTVTFASTYNGIAGAHYDATHNTQWLSWDLLRPRLEGYQYVPADECPIVTVVARPSAATLQKRAVA